MKSVRIPNAVKAFGGVTVCEKSSAIDDVTKTYSIKIEELLMSYHKGTSQKLGVQMGNPFTIVGMNGTYIITIQTITRLSSLLEFNENPYYKLDFGALKSYIYY